MVLGPLQNTAPLYTRSPFQVALLLFFSFGLYLFFWAFKVRRWCEVTLERPSETTWKTIALLVPIFNFFLLFELGQMIKGAAFRAGTSVNDSLPLLSIASFALNATSRLPAPYSALAVFFFVPITLIAFPFERAQLAIHGSAALPDRFNWFEWTLIVLGAALWILTLLHKPAAFSIIEVLLVIGLLAFFKMKSDDLVTRARQF